MKQIYYALKALLHDCGSQIIKVISLALGLLMSVFLFSRIAYELSFDNFWHESENIYYIKTAWTEDGAPAGEEHTNIKHAIPGAIAAEFPEEVESATTCAQYGNSYYLGNDRIELSTTMADTLFFATLGLNVIEGNPQDLANPDIVFLSESSARKIFGSESPLGKTLLYDLDREKVSLLVKGIFADIPLNTAMRFPPKAIVSFSSITLHTNARMGWASGGDYYGYLRLRSSADAKSLNERLSVALSHYLPEDGRWKLTAHIAPIRSLHLFQPEVRKMLWVMTLLGVVLLFTTALNYVLISIASLTRRAKAIGVHKCSGASERSIFSMFMLETAVVILLALILIALLVGNFREFFEELAGVPFNMLFAWGNLWAPLSVVALLFLIAGCMPGMLFSRIPVTQVFMRYTSGRRSWKRVLLFVQFGSAAFILGMLLVVYAQYSYVTTRDRGYRSERVAIAMQSLDRPDNLCSLLRGLPYVEAVALADNTLFGFTSPHSVRDSQGNILFYPRGTTFSKEFLPFMELRLVTGHNLTGAGQLLVNRKFVELMKWQGDGIGERVNDIGTVVGVLDDFSFARVPQDDDKPVMITYAEDAGRYVHVRLKEPFDDNIHHLNDEMKQAYPQNEVYFFSMEWSIRSGAGDVLLFCFITLLASVTILFIILMGLIGYVNDEIRLRSKEIAIRKINGAEAGSVLKLLSRDVLWLAIPAVAIGLFGAFKAGQLWISQFVDTVHLPVVGYVVVGICLILFIITCVVIKAWHIANENPVKSIKSE